MLDEDCKFQSQEFLIVQLVNNVIGLVFWCIWFFLVVKQSKQSCCTIFRKNKEYLIGFIAFISPLPTFLIFFSKSIVQDFRKGKNSQVGIATREEMPDGINYQIDLDRQQVGSEDTQKDSKIDQKEYDRSLSMVNKDLDAENPNDSFNKNASRNYQKRFVSHPEEIVQNKYDNNNNDCKIKAAYSVSKPKIESISNFDRINRKQDSPENPSSISKMEYYRHRQSKSNSTKRTRASFQDKNYYCTKNSLEPTYGSGVFSDGIAFKVELTKDTSEAETKIGQNLDNPGKSSIVNNISKEDKQKERCRFNSNEFLADESTSRNLDSSTIREQNIAETQETDGISFSQKQELDSYSGTIDPNDKIENTDYMRTLDMDMEDRLFHKNSDNIDTSGLYNDFKFDISQISNHFSNNLSNLLFSGFVENAHDNNDNKKQKEEQESSNNNKYIEEIPIVVLQTTSNNDIDNNNENTIHNKKRPQQNLIAMTQNLQYKPSKYPMSHVLNSNSKKRINIAANKMQLEIIQEESSNITNMSHISYTET